jgi:biotin operon repressor
MAPTGWSRWCLLLRRHDRLTATALARELEVSTRTVLRDIEALSAAGVPVYAERGRRGGFALMPGFRTEPTGLNHDEALALLVAGSRRGAQVFGLGSALASAMLKVVDALPESYRATASDAARRLLIDPETDLLSRRLVAEEVPDGIVTEVRRAVFAGHRLRIHYAAVDQAPSGARWTRSAWSPAVRTRRRRSRAQQDVDDACLSRAGVRVREEGQVGSPVGVHGGCHECTERRMHDDHVQRDAVQFVERSAGQVQRAQADAALTQHDVLGEAAAVPHVEVDLHQVRQLRPAGRSAGPGGEEPEAVDVAAVLVAQQIEELRWRSSAQHRGPCHEVGHGCGVGACLDRVAELCGECPPGRRDVVRRHRQDLLPSGTDPIMPG